MTSEFDRRLHRTENDVSAIYDILTDIQATQARHGGELARVRTKLREHDARFDAMDARFDGMQATLAELLRRTPDPDG